MRKLILLIAAILINSSLLWAADYFVPATVGSSARMVRTGHIEGFSNQANAVFDNPAGLYRIDHLSTTLFATTFMEEVSYQNLAFAMRAPYGVIGFGYMSVGVNGLISTEKSPLFPNADLTDPQQYDIIGKGTFDYGNRMFKVAYQFPQNEFISWGIGATYYTSTISTVNASGLNLDAGVVLDLEPVIFSITAKNIIPGMGVTYTNGGKEKLPLDLTFGMQYLLQDVELMAQVKASDGANKKFLKSVGANYHPEFLPSLTLSGGYSEIAVIKDVRSSFTGGIGFEMEGVSFDYAYETSDNVVYNGKHYFSLGLSF